MATLSKGKFAIDFGIITLEAELGDEDRQCAWELYVEMSTRVAVTGKIGDPLCRDFSGELYIESLESLYRFFQAARGIMRAFPVGRIRGDNRNHLGIIIHRLLNDVLRPFLETWQGKYRHWWEFESNLHVSPFRRQEQFSELKDFLEDWSDLRWLMREAQAELVKSYQLVDVTDGS
jgi:hypothetical protein